MGKKYIIELPENTHWIQWLMEGTEDHHPYMDFKSVEDLTPYTEPDLEQVRKEAYKEGREAGMCEAWEAARKICTNWCINDNDLGLIFGKGKTIDDIMREFTATEAIEKIRQYEQRQEEQITKGDIILIKSTPEAEILVTYANEEYVSGIALTEVNGNCEIGDQYTNIRISNVEKTGKHYDIVSALKKMQEGVR